MRKIFSLSLTIFLINEIYSQPYTSDTHLFNSDKLRLFQRKYLDSIIVENKAKIAFRTIADYNPESFRVRLDSMINLFGYTVFLREKYDLNSGCVTSVQYYFCNNCRDTGAAKSFESNFDKRYPRYQFTNDSMSPAHWSKYYFENPEAEDQWPGISSHFAEKKLLDKITLIITYEGFGEFCLGGGRQARRKAEHYLKRHYSKPAKPRFYQVESMLSKDTMRISFQIPARTRYKRIVEFHGF